MTTQNPAPAATDPVEDRRVQPDGPLSGEVQRGGFALDTSGLVGVPLVRGLRLKQFYSWSDLSPFEQGYVEAAFESLRGTPIPRDDANLLLSDGTPRKVFVEVGSGAHRSRRPRWIGKWGGWHVWDAGWMRLERGRDGRYRIAPMIAFRRLAPATLAGMLKDCEAIRSASPAYEGDEAAFGRSAWAERQAGNWPMLPPQTLSLSPEGKVVADVAR